MITFGEYLRDRREQLRLDHKEVAAELDFYSILSKIERSDRVPSKEMLPTLAKTLEVQEKEIEIEFIKPLILSDIGDLKPIADDMSEEEKLAIIQSEFERLYDPNHPVRFAIETLDSVEEVRIIKEALE